MFSICEFVDVLKRRCKLLRFFNVDLMVNALVIIPDRCASEEVYDGSKYLSAFIVAMVLNAFGSVSLYVLGVTYLDDASSHGTASLHIGRAYYFHSTRIFCCHLVNGFKIFGKTNKI